MARPQPEEAIATQTDPLVFKIYLFGGAKWLLILAIEGSEYPLVDPLLELPALGMDPLLRTWRGNRQLGQGEFALQVTSARRRELILMGAEGEQQLMTAQQADERLQVSIPHTDHILRQ